MSSKLMVNLIDSSEIVVPDTGGTPNTGVLGISQNSAGAAINNGVIIAGVIALIVIVAIIAIVMVKRHHKRSSVNSFTLSGFCKHKHLASRFAFLMLLVLAGVFGFTQFSKNEQMVNADSNAADTLAISTEDVAVNIDMEDGPAFGYGSSTVKVNSATAGGYTIKAYVDSRNTSLKNPDVDAEIEMLDSTKAQALTSNTWGVALAQPESQDSSMFHGLPTRADEAMLVKATSSATSAGDESTLYYAAYVTPDLPYGTYEGVTINYMAVANVVTDDITVKYYGNGYFFDEGRSRDVNTVTYGKSCGVSYIGGSCRKEFVGKNPSAVVKTSNINSDGTQNGAYPQSLPSMDYDGSAPIVYQKVNAPGADGLKVEVDYGITGDSYVVFVEGDWDLSNRYEEPTNYRQLRGTSAGTETFVFDSDTVTIFAFAYSRPIEDYDYGFYAKVYPLYTEEPEGIEVVSDTICYFAKSDNVDDDGTQIEAYEYSDWRYKEVTIPGADKLKVEIDYALSYGAEIDIIEGYDNGPWAYWEGIYTEGEPISGHEEFVFSGDTVTFEFSFWNEPEEGFDYGFYAKVYPIYSEEVADSEPIESCSVVARNGTYAYPLRDVISEGEWWYIVIEDDSYWNPIYWVSGEEGVESYLTGHYDQFVGRTVNVYAENYFVVTYNANGGTGYMSDQVVWPYDWVYIYSNRFSNPNHDFVGWNTEPDGSGTWYYPNDSFQNIGRDGETLVLYAIWGQ